jgi:tetratricopeptide (TPR) repeat protein
MMKRLWIITIITILFSGNLLAVQPEDGGNEAIFSFGAGARALALGSAVVAKPSDFTAIYWNPAYLDFVPRMQVGFFHTAFLLDTPYDFASFTFPTLRMGTFSGGVFRVATGGIQGYDRFGVPEETFSFSQEEFLFGYGKQILENGSAGLLMKIDHQSMLNNNATGISFDMAFSYIFPEDRPILSSLRTGVVVRNLLSTPLRLATESNYYPASYVFGFGRDIMLSPTHMITPLLDLEKTLDHSLRVRMGVEFNYRPYLAVRGGFAESFASFGLGVKIREEIGFDYAIRDTDFITQHLFSVNYSFGLSRDDKIALEIKEADKRIEREIKESFENRKEEEIKKHTEKAQQFFGERDYFASLNEWQQVLAWDEENRLARETIEEITVILNDLQEERDIDAATVAASKELFDVGIRYYTEKRYPEAMSSWERVLEMDPEHSLSQEYLDKATEEVRTLIHSHNERAVRLIRAGDYTGALNEYHIALRYDPQNLAILRGIKRSQNLIRSNESFREGLTYYLNGDYEAAVGSFTRAIDLNPDNIMVKDYLAEAESRSAGETTELQPELEKEYLAGVDLYLRGQYTEAIEIWERILEQDPHNQRVTRNITAARERLKTIEELGARQ